MGRLVERVDAWQRGHAGAAVPVALYRKFRDDRGTNLAALVTYYAFFSVFPLLLVFGLVTALWAGLGVMLALARAFETIWDVPRVEQRGAVAARLRGTVVLLVLGVGIVVSTVVTGSAVTGHFGPGAERLLTVAASVGLNALVFGVAFRVLGEPLRVVEILPGAAVAAVGALLLQLAGTWYVDGAVDRASDTYGAFAIVIGLLSWFLLGSNLLVLAAELNVVLHRRLWPRSLTGDLAPADRAAMRVAARAAQRDEREEIAVSFEDEGRAPDPL